VKPTISDPFLNEKATYTGILMSDLLKVAGGSASPTSVQLLALNDHEVGIPVADFQQWPILLEHDWIWNLKSMEIN